MFTNYKYKKIVGFLLITFFLLLSLSFIKIVGPIYLYYLKIPVDISIIRLISGIIIFFLLLLLYVKLKISPFSFFIDTVFFIILFIPSLVLFIASTKYRTDLFLFSALFMFLLILAGTVKFKSVKINHKFNDNAIIFILVTIAIILLLPFLITFNINIHPELFLLKNVYAVRAEAAHKFTFIHGYFLSWLSKIMIPVLLIYAYYKKKYPVILLGLAILIYMFLITGHKSIFFSILIIAPLSLKGSYYKQALRLSGIFVILVIFSVGLYLFLGKLTFVSLFIRRLLILPAVLNNAYFDIFQNFKMHLSHSIFSAFTESPINIEPTKYVCKEFWRHNCSANTGFLGDGFMNFGYAGVLIEIALVIVLFIFFNSQNISPRFSGLFFLISLTLISSAFLTSLMTHGLLLLILLTVLVLANTDKSD